LKEEVPRKNLNERSTASKRPGLIIEDPVGSNTVNLAFPEFCRKEEEPTEGFPAGNTDHVFQDKLEIIFPNGILQKQDMSRRREIKPEALVGKVDEELRDQLTILLCDTNVKLESAWKELIKLLKSKKDIGNALNDMEIVLITNQMKPILCKTAETFFEQKDCEAIVVPTNSFGLMEQGFSLEIRNRFPKIQQRLLKKLNKDKHNGEILVGQAVIIPTKGSPIHYIIFTPTGRLPGTVFDTPNAYLAFRGVLLAIKGHNKKMLLGPKPGKKIQHKRITRIVCPGLGTAVGRMPFDTCIWQMIQAYKNVVLGDIYPHTTLTEYFKRAQDLVSLTEIFSKEPNFLNYIPY